MCRVSPLQSRCSWLLVSIPRFLGSPDLKRKDCHFGSFGGTQGMQRGDQGGGGGADVRFRAVRRAAGAAGRARHPCGQVRPGLRQGGQGGRPRRRRPHGSFNSFQPTRLVYRLSPQPHCMIGVRTETGLLVCCSWCGSCPARGRAWSRRGGWPRRSPPRTTSCWNSLRAQERFTKMVARRRGSTVREQANKRRMHRAEHLSWRVRSRRIVLRFVP